MIKHTLTLTNNQNDNRFDFIIQVDPQFVCNEQVDLNDNPALQIFQKTLFEAMFPHIPIANPCAYLTEEDCKVIGITPENTTVMPPKYSGHKEMCIYIK